MRDAQLDERNWTGAVKAAPVLLTQVNRATVGARKLEAMSTGQLWFCLRFLFNNTAPADRKLKPHRPVDVSSWRTNPGGFKALVLALCRELVIRRDLPDHAEQGLVHICNVCSELWPQQRHLLP